MKIIQKHMESVFVFIIVSFTFIFKLIKNAHILLLSKHFKQNIKHGNFFINKQIF